jgi:hypothetical protein
VRTCSHSACSRSVRGGRTLASASIVSVWLVTNIRPPTMDEPSMLSSCAFSMVCETSSSAGTRGYLICVHRPCRRFSHWAVTAVVEAWRAVMRRRATEAGWQVLSSSGQRRLCGMEWPRRRSGVPRGDAYTLYAKNARQQGTRVWAGTRVARLEFQRRSAAPAQQRRQNKLRGGGSRVNVAAWAEAGVLGVAVVVGAAQSVPNMALRVALLSAPLGLRIRRYAQQNLPAVHPAAALRHLANNASSLQTA